MFKLPADFSSGSISNVPGILMKQSEQLRGVPLAGLAVKVTNGFFLIGFSAVETDRERNIQLLKERSWFDIPIVYTNNRRAILALEKGTPGERAFAEVFQAWGTLDDFPLPPSAAPPASQPVARDDTLDDFPLPPSAAPPASQPVAVPIERPEQTKTPPSARGSEVPAVHPQPVSAEPRERGGKAAEPRRASVERPHSKPALAPRQAKPRGSIRRCFVIGGRSYCE
jgi:hypothetical protein